MKVSLVLRDLEQALHRVLRLDDVALLLEAEAVLRRATSSICATTLRAPSCRPPPCRRFHAAIIAFSVARIAHDRHVHLDVLVDRGRVDVDVDLLRSRREGVEPARHPVVEARADVEHDVAAMHGEVRLVGAVHAEHAEEVRVAGRIGAEAHQRVRAGIARHAHELGQQADASGPN
jgi:hypothetical protein